MTPKRLRPSCRLRGIRRWSRSTPPCARSLPRSNDVAWPNPTQLWPSFAAEILSHYMDFYTSVFGRRCCACHDVLAAAIAVQDVVPTRAMTVRVTVNTSPGPARGATICDMRGQYRGEVRQPGATCTVVLETPGDFPERVLQRLLRI